MSLNTKCRTDLLNHLAEKYNLKRYLEIGLQNASQNFDKIKCEYKVSVDPDPNAHATFEMTSDEFFSYDILSEHRYDLIFLDGLHTAEQVQKDFENALKILSPNGFIVLHDCNPQKEEHTIVPRPTERGHWNGDVYKFAISLTGTHAFRTVDIDNGCGVFGGTVNSQVFTVDDPDMTWNYFTKHRKELLKLISWDEFTKL